MTAYSKLEVRVKSWLWSTYLFLCCIWKTFLCFVPSSKTYIPSTSISTLEHGIFMISQEEAHLGILLQGRTSGEGLFAALSWIQNLWEVWWCEKYLHLVCKNVYEEGGKSRAGDAGKLIQQSANRHDPVQIQWIQWRVEYLRKIKIGDKYLKSYKNILDFSHISGGWWCRCKLIQQLANGCDPVQGSEFAQFQSI